MEAVLTAEHPVPCTLGIQVSLLLLAAARRISAPLRNRTGGLELYRVPGGRQEHRVDSDWHAFLCVPTADQRPRSVPVVSDRVSVDGAVDALPLHAGERGRQDLVAGASQLHLFEQHVLHVVGVRETST